MSACDEYIQKLKEKLPEQCSVKDLISMGLFTSDQTARFARMTGDTPSYFKLRGRIIYPRGAVIEWLQNRKHEGKYADSEQTFEDKTYHKNSPNESRMARNFR